MKKTLKKNGKEKKRMFSFSLEADIREQLETLAKQTGSTKSEQGRRALKAYLNAGLDEGQVMLNLTCLTEKIQELNGIIDPDDYKAMEQYIHNIMVLKGGNDHGSF